MMTLFMDIVSAIVAVLIFVLILQTRKLLLVPLIPMIQFHFPSAPLSKVVSSVKLG